VTSPPVKPLVDTNSSIQIISSGIIRDRCDHLTEALRNSPGVGTFMSAKTQHGDWRLVYLSGFDAFEYLR
jgi:outer membrane receptor for monomeric catechols